MSIIHLPRHRALAQANVNRWFASGRRFGFLESLPIAACSAIVAFLAGFSLALRLVP